MSFNFMEPCKILTADFLDLLFDGRNKEYGAYNLRRGYGNRLRNAGMIMLIALILLSVGIVLNTRLDKKVWLPSGKLITGINLERVEPRTALIPKLPLPPKPELPKLVSSNQYVSMIKIFREALKPGEQAPDMNLIRNPGILSHTGNNWNNDHPGLEVKGKAILISSLSAHIFRSVEQMPEFPGGEDALLLRYLSDHTHYPAVAQENGIQGTVFLEFVVNADGSIQNVKVISNPIGGGCEDEAMRVVKSMPRWRPGRQNGQVVRVFFHLPVRFRLE